MCVMLFKSDELRRMKLKLKILHYFKIKIMQYFKTQYNETIYYAIITNQYIFCLSYQCSYKSNLSRGKKIHTYIYIYHPHQCGKIEMLENIIRELILFGFYGIG